MTDRPQTSEPRDESSLHSLVDFSRAKSGSAPPGDAAPRASPSASPPLGGAHSDLANDSPTHAPGQRKSPRQCTISGTISPRMSSLKSSPTSSTKRSKIGERAATSNESSPSDALLCDRDGVSSISPTTGSAVAEDTTKTPIGDSVDFTSGNYSDSPISAKSAKSASAKNTDSALHRPTHSKDGSTDFAVSDTAVSHPVLSRHNSSSHSSTASQAPVDWTRKKDTAPAGSSRNNSRSASEDNPTYSLPPTPTIDLMSTIEGTHEELLPSSSSPKTSSSPSAIQPIKKSYIPASDKISINRSDSTVSKYSTTEPDSYTVASRVNQSPHPIESSSLEGVSNDKTSIRTSQSGYEPSRKDSGIPIEQHTPIHHSSITPSIENPKLPELQPSVHPTTDSKPLDEKIRRSKTSRTSTKRSTGSKYDIDGLLMKNMPLPPAVEYASYLQGLYKARDRAKVYAMMINELSLEESGLEYWLRRKRDTSPRKNDENMSIDPERQSRRSASIDRTRENTASFELVKSPADPSTATQSGILEASRKFSKASPSGRSTSNFSSRSTMLLGETGRASSNMASLASIGRKASKKAFSGVPRLASTNVNERRSISSDQSLSTANPSRNAVSRMRSSDSIPSTTASEQTNPVNGAQHSNVTVFPFATPDRPTQYPSSTLNPNDIPDSSSSESPARIPGSTSNSQSNRNSFNILRRRSSQESRAFSSLNISGGSKPRPTSNVVGKTSNSFFSQHATGTSSSPDSVAPFSRKKSQQQQDGKDITSRRLSSSNVFRNSSIFQQHQKPKHDPKYLVNLDSVAKVLPQASRSTLSYYLVKNSGSDIGAITEYLDDERDGRLQT